MTCLISFSGFCQDFSSRAVVQKNREQSIIQATNAHQPNHFLNGRLYSMKYLNIKGSQFAMGEYLEEGKLIYNGVLMENMFLQYDAFRQLVITTTNFNKSLYILSLDKEKVSEFQLGERKFILYNDSILEKNIYEIIYESDDSKILIYHTKHITRASSSSKDLFEFKYNKHYYVINKYGSFAISRKKDMKAAFNEDSQIEKIIKKNKLKFNRARIQSSLYKALKTYDEMEIE